MYGLPQAGILMQNLLKKQLNQHGYQQSKVTPGLWKHDRWLISFTLYVDDFGIKYVGQEHANCLAKILNEHYKRSIDWNGKRYLGMNMDWDYDGRRVNILMLNYISKALTRFQNQAPNKPQHQPYPCVKPNYGAKVQYAEDMDMLTLLPKEDKKFIQEVIGLSSIMHNVLTAPCLRHWGLLLHNRRTQLRTR
jgi:hypothetical protein